MFAGELTRECVEIAHALYSEQERLVVREARFTEHCHLLAKMALQFVNVRTMDRPPMTQVRAPLRNLFFEQRALRRSRHAVRVFIQTCRSALSTTCHCCCWEASCARPAVVML